MREIRKQIDKVDSKILPLMIKRSRLVSKALDLKTRESEIIDRKRINQIKKKLQASQKSLGPIQSLLVIFGWQ